jgi:chromate transporter
LASIPARAAADPGEIGILATEVPALQLLIAFTKISVRSWGGGSGTTYTMHQELTRRGWITSGQFALDFGLVRLVPGINLIALAIVTGYRLNGPLGAIASCLGFMIPASVITILLTIGFAAFTSYPVGNAMLKGVVPVTAALTYAMAYQNGEGVFPRKERRVLGLMICYVVGAFVASAVFHLSVVFIILAGAVLGAFFFRPSETTAHASDARAQS